MYNRINTITITEVEDVITFFSPKGRYRQIDNRPSYGLSFCSEGQITYTHKGIKHISDKNHAIILPQNESYTLFGDKTGMFPVINFKCLDFLCDTMLLFPIDNLEPYIMDYEQIKALKIFDGNRTKILSLFYGILHRLSSSNNLAVNLLAPAMKYIEQNYSDAELSNTVLARKCGVSEVYFRRLFLQNYNVTPKQFIIDIRIDRAKQLLADGILKINVIAEECGFSNPYHFCRLFKQRTGLTPTEYMKENKVYKI